MELAIEIENLTKKYPGRTALNNVSFKVKKGSIHGFLGPNGAGKSTTMKILSGLLPASSGHFKLHGQVGFLPEHPPVYPNMSVRDYLLFVCAIYAEDVVEKSKIDDVLIKTGLKHVENRLIGNLSKGYQQRVGIAQALVHSPEIIILDEPTVGLDPVAILEIRNLLKDLTSSHTILFSSHQLYDVEMLCSDITLINHGEIVVSGAMDEILKNLRQGLHLKAKVFQFSEEHKKALMQECHLLNLDFQYEKENEIYHLNIVAKNPLSKHEKVQASIARYLSQESIGLLEFSEERLDLEDLFKRIGH